MTAGRARTALPLPVRAVWNLRRFALLLVGPVLGVWLATAVFGMPAPLRIVAGAVLLLDVALFGVLARGEWRRLAPRG